MKRENLKAFKGLLAFVLALLLALPAGLAFADELNDLEKNRVEDVDAGKACSLTLVLSYENDEGETVVVPDASVKLYKVADLTTAGGSATYALTSAYAGTGVVFEGMTASESVDAADLLAASAGEPLASAVTDATGTAAFDGLTPGMYLLVQDSEFSAGDGSNLEFLPTLVAVPQATWNEEAAINQWNYDVTAAPKVGPKTTRVSVDPPVTKTVTGDKPSAEGTFTFTLTADPASSTLPDGMTEMPMPEDSENQTKSITVTGRGQYEFGPISYKLPGTYVYTVTEEAVGEKDWNYDGSTYVVTHTVTGDGANLDVETVITRDGAAVSQIEFVNEYRVDKPMPFTSDIILPFALVGGIGATVLVIGLLARRKKGDD